MAVGWRCVAERKIKYLKSDLLKLTLWNTSKLESFMDKLLYIEQSPRILHFYNLTCRVFRRTNICRQNIVLDREEWCLCNCSVLKGDCDADIFGCY